MAAGMQAFDAKGALTADLTKHFAKLVGSKTVSGNGQISVSTLAANNKLWYFITSHSVSYNGTNKPLLRIDSDGKTIRWENIQDSVTFYYGVY